MKTEKQLKQQKNEKHVSKKNSKKNADPASDDHLQQIPHRLREIMKSKEKMKQGSQKRKKATEASKPKMLSGDIPIPHFRRGRKESEKNYVRRMTEETEHVLFLTNNQVQRHPEVKLKKEEDTEEKKSTKKKWLHKRKLQQQKKKLNQQAEHEEEEMFKDEVPFGEVAMAPPSLSVKPKKAVVKPKGATKGLLLNSLLGHSPASLIKPSMARKRIVEEERERVVQLYRQMKQKQRDKQEQDKAAMTST
ncbi:coiled-coil domain-containing protein 137 isoform X1 [Sinocyclocheilus grahami]|uniref:Coiled-coil domain containing 137 n=2 Tax=Sinocyclocheilus grahami TaxID=75366 RepID=A0A672PNN4_SINGR|nr:PREDICTED: coiled-coil domain-containing protein 137 isoform X1 [Sinocyclocheilus grahami]